MGPRYRPKKKGNFIMKNSRRIKRMVGIATLAAITVVLQVISNYIKFGPVNITLALIPMVVGSILYGPLAGFGLGTLMGVVILTAPDTALFWNFNPWITIVLCILKTGLAGLASGWIFKGLMQIKALKKFRFPVAVITATLIAPLINTGLFILGTSVLFRGLSTVVNGETIVLVPSAGSFGDAFAAALGFVILTNFLVEFAVSVLLSPSVIYLIRILSRNFNIGMNFNEGILDDTMPSNELKPSVQE